MNNGGTVILADVEISENTEGMSGKGGGVYKNEGLVALSHVDMHDGGASFGGGIFNDCGTVTITNSNLSQNQGYGGGIINDGEVTITNSLLLANRVLC